MSNSRLTLVCRFLLKYYQKASDNSGELHKFYKKNAICSFGDDQNVVGSSSIKQKLNVLNGAQFDLENGGQFSFQPTQDNGVLVMVSAIVSLREPQTSKLQAPRRFVQTFLLSREDERSFSIVNDMHRFVSGQTHQAVKEEQPRNGKLEETSEPVPKTKDHPRQKESNPVAKSAAAEKGDEGGQSLQPNSYAQAAKASSSSPNTLPSGAQAPSAGFPVFVKATDGKKIDEDALKEACQTLGSVLKISMNHQKPSAVVTFSTSTEAAQALAVNRILMKGIEFEFEVHRGSRSRSSRGASDSNKGDKARQPAAGLVEGSQQSQQRNEQAAKAPNSTGEATRSSRGGRRSRHGGRGQN